MQKGVVPPTPQKGVVIVLRDNEAELGRAVAHTIGRALMAARVACITDDDALDRRPHGADRRRREAVTSSSSYSSPPSGGEEHE